MLCDRALRTFLKRLPYIGLLSLVVGVLGAVMAGPLWGLAITVFVVVGFYLSVVEGGRLRAKRMAAATGEKERFLQLTLTDEGLVLRSRDGEERRLPWKAVRRAVAGRIVWNSSPRSCSSGYPSDVYPIWKLSGRSQTSI